MRAAKHRASKQAEAATAAAQDPVSDRVDAGSHLSFQLGEAARESLQIELFKKTTAFVATALVPFAAKVSVVPCCSVRFGTAEREQAELNLKR